MNQTQFVKKSLVGLTPDEISASRQKYGPNVMTPPKKTGFWGHFRQNLNDPVIRILLLSLGVNLVFLFRTADWAETIGIAVSVFLATFISTLSEYGSENAFLKLDRENENYPCRVRRGGVVSEIPLEEIVVGDIVLLSAGDKIPADGFIVSGSLGVDQAAMTGESREVPKAPRAGDELSPGAPSALLGGCLVLSGEGEMRVSGVGDATFLGEISREIQKDTRESPLKLRLSKLASQISRLGYAAAGLIFLVYLCNSLLSAPSLDLPSVAGMILEALTLGLSVIVVAVPEGLPMMIAVVLSSNIRKMAKAMVLVRKPVGIESAGSMNILFTDKTGTLTRGHPEVLRFFTSRDGYPTPTGLRKDSPALWEQLQTAAYITTDAEWSASVVVGGNATDRALLSFLGHVPFDGKPEILQKIPFDSQRKYAAATVFRGKELTYFKGAPEVILPHVTRALDRDGSLGAFDRFSFEEQITRHSLAGARVIVTAYGAGRSMEDLTLIGGVAMEDRIRAEAPHAVETLRKAGIRTVMITGDSLDTARSVAQKCGLWKRKEDICLTGKQLSAMSDTEVSDSLPHLCVVARALPGDKTRLTRIAQEAGLVCGMTGDGINDAPALRRADIGFSMGSGSQVAKEAGDIIILDDNLSSIVRAVLYGRNIFKSIRKFITLQLTMNLCAVGVCMLGPFVGIERPVTVVQMLWVNMIMDTLGGLAFAGEPPLPAVLSERPKRRDEPILNRYMIHEILFLGIFTIILSLVFLKSPSMAGKFRQGPEDIYLLTGFFAFFIFAGVCNCFNARTDRMNLLAGIRKNKLFLAIMSLVTLVQIGFVYLGGEVLRSAPLLLSELLHCFLMALWVIPAELARKIIWKLFIRKGGY